MLHNLNNKTIINNTKILVAKEKLLCAKLIAYLAEVDQRRLYADEGYPSMFRYLVDGFKYSEPAAARRLSAARLSRQFPKILKMLELGTMHLTGLHLISSEVSTANGDRLLSLCENKTKREIEEILVREVGRASISHREVVKFVAPIIKIDNPSAQPKQSSIENILNFNSPVVNEVPVQSIPDIRISITLDQKTYDKLKRAQAISGADTLADAIKRSHARRLACTDALRLSASDSEKINSSHSRCR